MKINDLAPNRVVPNMLVFFSLAGGSVFTLGVGFKYSALKDSSSIPWRGREQRTFRVFRIYP